MLNVESVNPAIEKFEAAQVDLRSALADAAQDKDVDIQRVKELTGYHDHAGSLARELTEWKKRNTAAPTKIT